MDEITETSYTFGYKWTRVSTEEFYYGIHTGPIDDGYTGSGVKFLDKFKNTDRSDWKWEVVFLSDNREEVIKWEQNTVNEEVLKDPLCLNLKTGGLNLSTYSEESRAKIALSQIGSNNVIHLPGVKEKIQKSKRDYYSKPGKERLETLFATYGFHKDTGERVGPFYGNRELEEVGFCYKHIPTVTKGKREHSQGFIWFRVPKEHTETQVERSFKETLNNRLRYLENKPEINPRTAIFNIFDYETDKVVAENTPLRAWCDENNVSFNSLQKSSRRDLSKSHCNEKNPHYAGGGHSKLPRFYAVKAGTYKGVVMDAN